MTPEVWKNSSEVLFHNAFRSPRILHVLRQIILRYIFMTDDSDAYGMANEKLKTLADALEANKELSYSTDFKN